MWVQKVPGGGVQGVGYSPDGTTLYTADRAGWVTAWDPLTHAGRRLFRLAPHERAHGVWLHVLPDGGLFTHAANAGSGTVWDADGGLRSRVPGEWVRAGRVLRVRGGRLYARADRPDAVATWELPAARPGPVLTGWHTLGELRAFDLAPDGRTAAVADTQGYVTLCDVAEERPLHRFEPDFGAWGLSGLWFAPDGGTLVLTAGPRVRFWDVAARATRAEVVLAMWPHFAPAFHPAAPLFGALGAGGLFTLYRLGTSEPVRALDFALGAQVLCAAFAPDGLTCSVGGSNRQFAVFDVDV